MHAIKGLDPTNHRANLTQPDPAKKVCTCISVCCVCMCDV